MLKLMSGFMLAALLHAYETNAQGDSSKVCESNCCCSKEVALPAGVMLGHIHAKGEWMLSYRYMNMTSEGLQNGASAVSNDEVFKSYLMVPEEMHMNMHMVMAMYGLSNRLTLMAMFHYNNNIMHMQMFGEGQNHTHGVTQSAPNHDMHSMGLGDIKLYGIYALLNQSKHKLMLNAGLSIPTGSVALNNDNGKRLPYMMQMGSGTFDLLPGISYLYHQRTSTFGVQGNANIRLGYNASGYSWGNELSFNSWYAYRWLHFLSSSLRAEFIASEAIYGHDPLLYKYVEPSANASNYGGQRASVFAGTVWQPLSGTLKNWQLAAEVGLPLYQNFNGIQAPTKLMINANLNVTF